MSKNKLTDYSYLKNQTGFAHILALVVLVVGLLVGLYLITQKTNLFPKAFLPKLGQTSTPTVTVKKEYKNPFDKETQYVNPFDQYKSPLVNLKKS